MKNHLDDLFEALLMSATAVTSFAVMATVLIALF